MATHSRERQQRLQMKPGQCRPRPAPRCVCSTGQALEYNRHVIREVPVPTGAHVTTVSFERSPITQAEIAGFNPVRANHGGIAAETGCEVSGRSEEHTSELHSRPH